MKVNIEEIRITRGEFRILPPEEMPSSGEDQGPNTATLIIGCEFALINNKGEVLALGHASNSPNSATQSELSSDTLSAFQHFFTLLEQDVANSFGQVRAQKDDVLARILGGELPE